MGSARLFWLGVLAPLCLWAEPPKSAPTLPAVEAGAISSFEDPSTKRDSISLSFGGLSSGKTTYTGLGLSFYADASDAEEVRVILSYKTPSWEDCGLASLTVDGKKPKTVAAPESHSAEHHTGDRGGFHSYSYSFSVSWEDFASFRKAKKIEGKMCGLRFSLTPKERESLKTFGDYLATHKTSPALPKVPVGRVTRAQEPKTGNKQLTLSLEELSSAKKKVKDLGLLVQAYETGATEIELVLSYKPPKEQKGCGESSSLLVDGVLLTLPQKATYSSGKEITEMGDILYHLVRMTLSREAFASLVKAKKVEGEFCGASFVLSKKQLEALVLYEKALLPAGK